jgi:hypothetical protein
MNPWLGDSTDHGGRIDCDQSLALMRVLRFLCRKSPTRSMSASPIGATAKELTLDLHSLFAMVQEPPQPFTDNHSVPFRFGLG